MDETVVAAVGFEKVVSKEIGKFEISQQKCDERLGVMLLLEYKQALDEMNKYYLDRTTQMSVPGSKKVTFDTELHIRARDRYEAHLQRLVKRDMSLKDADASKTAHHKTLLSTAARMHTQDLKTHEFSLSYPSKDERSAFDKTTEENESLYPVLALNQPLQGVQGTIHANGSWSREHYSWNCDYSTNKEYVAFRAFLERSSYGLIGGFALIIPMLIMKLYPTTLNVCLTTTLFVILVGQVLAGFLKDSINVLKMTAAYAAVLVVIVGTTTKAVTGGDKQVAIIVGGVCVGIVVTVPLLWLLTRAWERLRIGNEFYNRKVTDFFVGLPKCLQRDTTAVAGTAEAQV